MTKLLIIPSFVLLSGFIKCPTEQGKESSLQTDTLHNPLSSLTYDRVVAYNINYDSAKHKKIYKEFEFYDHPEKYNFNQQPKCSVKTLDSAQIAHLSNVLNDTATYGGDVAACFYPRLGFTFFSGNKAVFNIFICFECNYLVSSKTFPASVYHGRIIETSVPDKYNTGKEKDTTIFLADKGFSAAGKNNLLKICHDLGMLFCSD